MLSEATYAATDVEREAVEALLVPYSDMGATVSVTRVEPGETGPLRVEITGALRVLVYEVNEDGTVEDLNFQHGFPEGNPQ